MSMLIAIVAGLVVLAGIWFIVPFVYRKREEDLLAQIAARRKVIVLTYDDGPSPLTSKLLDLFDKHDVHATFFALGKNAEKYPDLLQRALQAGHEVGSHTFNHTNAWKCDPISAARDLNRGIDTVSRLGGDKFSFRPPYGKLTIVGLIDGLMRGLHFGWWTVDSQDSWNRRPIPDVLAEIERKAGGVILMHDFDSYEKAPAHPSHVDHVLALTEQIIHLAKARGYRFATLASLRW